MKDDIQFGMEMLEHLPLVEAPDEIWAAIENRRAEKPAQPIIWRWAASVLLVLAGVVYWQKTRWIETGATVREIKIGDIGTVEIQPNTRLRVITERPGEHRLRLGHGEIRAKITAPPRLFFVDTAAGTAIDLGCEYALSTDEDGAGVLRVTKGWVSFQWKGQESLVPAGASCKTLPHSAPGVPYFDDASDVFKLAVDRAELTAILLHARVRDTLTLWHLLSRVDATERAAVYDRIAALTPVPAGVSRAKALSLDPDTLTLWRKELAWTW